MTFTVGFRDGTESKGVTWHCLNNYAFIDFEGRHIGFEDVLEDELNCMIEQVVAQAWGLA